MICSLYIYRHSSGFSQSENLKTLGIAGVLDGVRVYLFIYLFLV